MRRILIISSEFPPNVGGIGNHAYNLAKALANEGFEMTVMADVINVSAKEQREFSNQHQFSIAFIKRSGLTFLTYLQRLSKGLVLSGRADLIICSGKFPLWLAIPLRIFSPKKKIMAVVHGSELDLKNSLVRRLTNFALRKFNTIISVSTYTEKHLPANLPQSIKKVVIPNGIDCSEFEKQANHVLEGEPSLITIGSVTPRKGQENVINALPSIKSYFPKAKFHVVGKPVIKEKLVKRCKHLGLNGTVQFYGAVARQELLEKLSSAKIKLMLSNHTDGGDFEGFGIAVLEANAFGVPAVGSVNSGIADAIVNGQTGLLVDPAKPEEVSLAVVAINNNYSFFSDNAKKWAMQHDWKIIVKKYIAAFE